MTKDRLLQALLYLPMLLLALTGILSPYKYNLLPSSAILELAFFLMACLMAGELLRSASVFLYGTAAYVAISAIWSIGFRDIHALDFLLAYKAFLYVCILCFFMGKRFCSRESLIAFYWAMLGAFAIKYGYSILLGLDAKMRSRPGLFVENNFELVFIILLFYRLRHSFKNSFVAFIPLFAIVFLSGSRSAILAVGAVYAFTFIREWNVRTVAALVATFAIAAVGYELFLSRTQDGFENIDRFKFLMVFLHEMQSHGMAGYVFGTPRITPLSAGSCDILSFYSGLFSFSDDSTLCYSVILHSYILRVIFDHGLIGFVFLNVFLLYGVRKANGDLRDFLCVALVLIFSGLSVSSFNSIFSALAVALLFTRFSDDENEEQNGSSYEPVKNINF